MDGAKLVADTVDLRKECGKSASYLGRSIPVKEYRPDKNENPGGSKILAVWESLSP